ncbi:MOSC domain-containing protein [Luteimonas arsenica]|uniref:MOSC domain-containing protein n=1 Tax=Luteimonas arsenica TaxID=1586242 RepID=UPI001055ECF4|nr:MOSC domain-containing protein [Luteimonas arsenica]
MSGPVPADRAACDAAGGDGQPAVATRIDALLTGVALPYTRPGSRSGIAKSPRSGRVRIGELGLEGDEQGDLRVHGGVDKAVHHYPFDHYAAWRAELGELPLLATPGAFGENISSHGLDEGTVCLGDRYALGDAVLEVSQGRQPCWKLNDRFGVRDMARRVQDTGRTGWYYRVPQPGSAQAGDALVLLERPWPAWPLRRLMRLLADRVLDPGQLAEALELPLVPSWRKLVERRLASSQVEDWARRIDGPPQG